MEWLRTLWRKFFPVATSRHYDAARLSRLNFDWTTVPYGENYELRRDLRVLRARARDMCRNNGYGKRFLTLLKSNVIGSGGIRLQVRAKRRDGQTLNTQLNRHVEQQFREWCYKENCTVSKKRNWRDVQKLVVATLAKDGEILIQKVKDPANPFGFALKPIDVNYLDETFNEILPNGNRVIMSVEIDENDAPQAYWLTPPQSEMYLSYSMHREYSRTRIPVEDMLHIFLQDNDPGQVRGLTWFYTTLANAKDLDGYKVGVITSARVSANTMGIVIPPASDTEFDGTDKDGNEIFIDSQPLSWHQLPPGYTVEQFDPRQPTQDHAEFYKSILRDLAVSLDVNYFNLATDLESVNYSSARVGLLEERGVWKDIQEFVIEHFCREVFNAWLPEAILAGRVRIYNPTDFAEVANPSWRARGWTWVDPQKEVNAQVTALQNGLTTRTDILAEQGKDFEELVETVKLENEILEQAGISFGTDQPEEKDNPQEEDPNRTYLGFPKTKALTAYSNGDPE